LRKDGFSEGTVGAVQTFFFRAEDGPWTTQRLAFWRTAAPATKRSDARRRSKISRAFLRPGSNISHRRRSRGPNRLGDFETSAAVPVRDAKIP
jgi:hypothetical protein